MQEQVPNVLFHLCPTFFRKPDQSDAEHMVRNLTQVDLGKPNLA